jgi:hypothetical protein
MMKIQHIILSALLIFSGVIKAQEKLDDFGRIVLNSYLSDKLTVPQEAKNFLLTKLTQITSNNGMGGSAVNPRFIITANVNVGTKDIIAGPPQMIAQNLEVTLLIGDAISNTVFSNVILNIKGVGTNENKAYVEAFKSINPKNPQIVAFLEEGKQKIIQYYSTQCDFIIEDAMASSKLGNYDDAIYKLALVPEVCQECYFKCIDTMLSVYQTKIDTDGKKKFNDAKVVWAGNQTAAGAEQAGELLSQIDPMAGCQPEVTQFINSINAKLKADEKAKWDFKMKQYADKVSMQKEQMRIAESQAKRDDQFRENQASRDAASQERQSKRNYELDKLRVNAYRQVATEYARNQPKTVTYNNINWR